MNHLAFFGVVQLFVIIVDVVDGLMKNTCYEPNPKKAKYSYDPGSCLSPPHWSQICPKWINCTTYWNLHQSPINIKTVDSVYRPSKKLGFENLCKRVPGKTRNNGHCPHFDTNTKAIKMFNVPGQGHDNFIFKGMHIHTGALETAGSEHSIDNNFAPLELHAVFYNERHQYKKAKKMKGGLAAISVQIQIAGENDFSDGISIELKDKEVSGGACPCFILDLACKKKKCACKGPKDVFCKKPKTKVCSNNFREGLLCRASGIAHCEGDEDCSGMNKCRRNDFLAPNKKSNNYCGLPKVCRVRYARELSHLMESYYDKIRHYKPKNARGGKKYISILENITPRDILPYSWNYYTYSGSLTTPPCYETVQWINMRCPIKISRKAYKMLQRIEDTTHKPIMMHGTRRPIQRGKPGMHSVKVYRNFQWNEAEAETLFCDVN